MISKDELKRLRELPIEGVAGRLGLKVERHLCLCPFHADKHPSLHFNVRRNSCRCYVCMDGDSLGPIDLVMRVQGVSFRKACEWLADEHNVILRSEVAQPSWQRDEREGQGFDPGRYERFFERPWLSPEARRFLYDERRLDARVVSWCRLTSWTDRQGVPWLQTPYYDREGRLIGVQNRRLDPQSQAPRFRFVAGCRPSIYGLQILPRLKAHDELWLAEGCSDCWSLLSMGRKALAIPSATLLLPKDKEMLVSLADTLSLTFHMSPDNDEPGRRLAAQLGAVLPNLEIHELPPGVKDVSEAYQLTL